MLLLLVNIPLNSQNTKQIPSKKSFWEASDTLNKKRIYFATSIAVGSYAVASLGLYNAWYRKNRISEFHFFNDNKEWGGMDKYGHLYSAYVESALAYKSAKWAGMSDNKSILIGAITGGVVQTTIEIMDGFSDKWGFSYADMGMNAVGIAAFGFQQRYWGEQRIRFKVSSHPRSYDEMLFNSTDGFIQNSVQLRSDNLFGTDFLSRYLKDYNAQTYWASINVASFLSSDTKFPQYLNLALGFGVENMFGGFDNTWSIDNHQFELDNNEYERYHQFYIGLDLDLSKIKTNNHFLKTVFTVFNIFKVPAPAIEFNTKGEVIFHLLKI